MQGTIRKGEELSGEKLERRTNHERLLTLGNTQRVVEGEMGRGLDDWVTGTEGALDGLSTGCYSICRQIELK